MLNFISVLSDSPATGHAFIVSGKTTQDAQKFNVSLACGKSGNCDIALMLVCDFNDGKIIRCSLINGSWSDSETEENRTSQVSNPIRRGDNFKIYILVGDGRFHVSINDVPFCTYNFKNALNQIKAVSVSGDVEKVTQMDHRLIFPMLYPLVNNDTPDIAFSGFIPSKYAPGHVTMVTGVASGNPQGEFVVMFNENGHVRQLLHLNIRFDQQNVVMNTMNGDDDCSWGDAETHSNGAFPFAFNQPFKMALAFTESDFKVAVNGQFLMDFALDNIELDDGESLWDILTGFQIKIGADLKLQITNVEHVQSGSRSCDGFESYSNFSAF